VNLYLSYPRGKKELAEPFLMDGDREIGYPRRSYAKTNIGRIMRRVLVTLPLILAAIFLFSVLTPEPGYIQGYPDDGIPAFVESDAAFSLCSTFVVTTGYHPSVLLLPFVEQVPCFPSHTISMSLFYRGPPSSSAA
jgi:hypothetical protein